MTKQNKKITRERIKPRFYIFCYTFTDKNYPMHLKYGISTNIQKRIVGLQTPVKPNRVVCLNFNTLYQARAFEKYFKKMVADYNTDEEWLMIKDEKSLSVVETIFDNFSSFCEDLSLAEFNVIKPKNK